MNIVIARFEIQFMKYFNPPKIIISFINEIYTLSNALKFKTHFVYSLINLCIFLFSLCANTACQCQLIKWIFFSVLCIIMFIIYSLLRSEKCLIARI